MSYLPELIGKWRVSLAKNPNIPVALRAVKTEGAFGVQCFKHVLTNAYGCALGHMPKPGVDMVTASWDVLATATPQQQLVVSTCALMELLPQHPSSLVALEHGSSEKWKERGDNVGFIDIPLIYPQMLPMNSNGLGLEMLTGLYGCETNQDPFHTDRNTSAGQLAYSMAIEPMLAKVAALVLEPNRFRDCGNPFLAYIRAGHPIADNGYRIRLAPLMGAVAGKAA